ncbi:hypothetical protein B0H11DRAFT_2255011 [Mycena galericulata]|nr:hypothetical protein B0H11DRAFT_2255011 [Mycena galericulata]
MTNLLIGPKEAPRASPPCTSSTTTTSTTSTTTAPTTATPRQGLGRADPSNSSATSSWEAKVRVGGDFAASQFVEVGGAEAVERELRRVLTSSVAVDCIDEYLGVMYDLTPDGCAVRMMMTALC